MSAANSQEDFLLSQIDRGKLPKHIAIIMDGNGRWALKRGLPRTHGHKKGVDAVMQTIEGCRNLGVPNLSLFAFSTENIKRPEEEKQTLFDLFVTKAEEELSKLKENNIRVMFIGDYDKLPDKVYKTARKVEEETQNNTALNVIVALYYSGIWDIINAVKKILISIKGEIDTYKTSPSQIIDKWINSLSDVVFKQFLATRGIPDPDILIRTSGEKRISNFYLYQISYTEIFFIDTLWPDFSKNELYSIIIEFQKRERRYGMI